MVLDGTWISSINVYFRRSNCSNVLHVDDVHREDDRALADLRQSNHELLKRSKGYDFRFPINNGNISSTHSIIIDIHSWLVTVNMQLVPQYSSEQFVSLLTLIRKCDSLIIHKYSPKPIHNNIACNNKAYSLIA